MNRVSMCVPSWNEGAALQRLLLSSVHASRHICEWVVLDHRSTDDTQARLDAVEPILAAVGVRLRRLHERRDFNRNFTMSDLRNAVMRACRARIVCMMDADFILGAGFVSTLATAVRKLASDVGPAVVTFPIPVVWDHLSTNAGGRITRHGRVWRHPPSNRIMLRDRVEYRQTGGNGRWERIHHLKPAHARSVRLPNDGNVLVSVNVKPPERIDVRATMTFFLEDVLAGKIEGDWLSEYARGNLRARANNQYRFEAGASLVGRVLNIANLNEGAPA